MGMEFHSEASLENMGGAGEQLYLILFVMWENVSRN